MSIGFNAKDIFEIAKQIERNGAAFYRKAAECTTDPDVKQMLINLAAMEDEHLATFNEIEKTLAPEESRPTAFDPDDQEAQYLKAIADGHVFDINANPADKLKGDESFESIIKTAMSLEKDSIIFYLGIRQLVPEAMGLDKIDDIIREEMSHVAILSKWLAVI